MQAILDWITVNEAYAGAFIFLISCVESLALVGILLPGMAIMLGIGTLVGLGVIPFWTTVLWAALGAIVGDGISFWLGRHFNQRLHHVWPLSRYPNLIPKGEQFFHKHGELSILFGRFVGPLRAIVPAVAGMMEMSPWRFYLMNIISAMAWAPMVVIPGAVFGASTQVAAEVSIRLALLVVMLLLILWFLGWFIHRGQQFFLDAVQKLFPIPARKITYFFYTTLIIIGISGLSLFLTKKSAEISSNFEQTQWWSHQWRPLADANSEYNIQYSGELSVIRHLVEQASWYYPTVLTTSNVLQWLAPSSELQDLPLPFGAVKKESTEATDFDSENWYLVFAENYADNNSTNALVEKKRLYVLSLKRIESVKNGPCLWLGQLQKLTYQPLVLGVGFPYITKINKIPEKIVADVNAIEGLELVIRKHNKSELLTIRTMEIVKCSLKNY